MTAANHFTGLGARPGATPATGLQSDDQDDFARPSIKRSVPAAGAPSVLPANAIVSPFAHPYTPSAGSAGDVADPPAAATHHEENSMPKKPAAPAQPPGPRNLQQRICAVILQAESISRQDLTARLPDLTPKQLSQTLFNIDTAKRAKKVETSDGPVWQLTRYGIHWLENAKVRDRDHPRRDGAPEPAKRAKKAVKAAKAEPVQRTRARPGSKVRKPPRAGAATLAEPTGNALALHAFEPVVERSFRCAVFSDDAFHLAKNGHVIDLTPAEFAEMLRYVERMAEQRAA